MTEADIAAVQAVVKHWRDAILARDWDVFARLYTRDAVLMPPNAVLVVGPAAIAAWFGSPGITLQAFTTRPGAVDGEGVLAMIRSAYAMTFTVPGSAAPLTERGKGLLVLRRDDDHVWRIAIDIWNADAPAAPEP